MATAFPAVLPLTEFCLLECSDMFRTSGDTHGVGLPKSKGVDRAKYLRVCFVPRAEVATR